MNAKQYVLEQVLDRLLVRVSPSSVGTTESKIWHMFMPVIIAVQVVILPLHPYLMAGTRRFKFILPPELKSDTSLSVAAIHTHTPSVENMDGEDVVTVLFRSLKHNVLYPISLTFLHDRPYVLSQSLRV
jgi:hypothetical protein